MTHVTFQITQDASRVYADGTESASVALATVNTNPTIAPGTTFLARFLIRETDGGSGSKAFIVRYSKNGGSFADITTTSSNVKAVNSGSLTDGDDTTQRIGSGTFISNNNAVTEDGTIASVTFAASEEIEILSALQIVASDVVDGDVIELAIFEDFAVPLDAYTADLFVIVLEDSGSGLVIEQLVLGEIVASSTLTLPEISGGTDMLYLVAVGTDVLVNVSSISGGSLTWSLEKRQGGGRGQDQVEIWSAFGSPSAFQPAITMASSSDALIGSCTRISGADTSTPTEDPVGENTNGENGATSGGTDDNAVTLTTGSTNADSIHFVALVPRLNEITVDDANFIRRSYNQNGAGGDEINLYVETYLKSATGDDTYNVTLSSTSDWCAAGVVVIPASGTAHTQTVAGTLTSAGILLIETQKVIAGTLATVGVYNMLLDRSLIRTLTTGGGLIKETQRNLSGTLTLAGILVSVKLVMKSIAGTLTTAGALIKETRRDLLATLTTSGGFNVLISRALAGTLTTAGALIKETQKAFTGTLTSVGVLIREAQKSLTGTLTTSGGLSKLLSRTLSGTLTSAGGLIKQTQKVLAGILTTAGVLTTIKLFQRAFTATLTTAGDLTKRVDRSLGGTLTSVGTLVIQTQKSLAGALSTSGILTTIKQFVRALSGTLTSVGTLTKETQRNLTSTLTTAGGLIKQTQKVLTATLTTVGALSSIKQFTLALTATLTSAGTLTKETRRSLVGALTSAGTLIKQIQRNLVGTLTSAGTLVKQTQKALTATLTSTGALIKRTLKVLTSALTSAGALATSFISGSIRQAIAGTLTMAGTLTTTFTEGVSIVAAAVPSVRRLVERMDLGGITDRLEIKRANTTFKIDPKAGKLPIDKK